jgi:2Fe-2S ferredoxin
VSEKLVHVTFILANGSKRTVAGCNISVMQLAVHNNISGIVADCGGALSCATCHVHLAPEWTDRLAPRSEQEMQMLEMAIDPDETSRLSCQITLSDELDGLTVRVPIRQF